jgi:uncharacterized SAM-binding protein YcdF (DUF218 family)
MFLMKKIVSRFLFPLPLSLEFLLVGLFLLWFTRRQRAGKALVTCGTILILTLSNGTISDSLLRPLEHRYLPLAVGHSAAGAPAAAFIVVLGGFGDHDPDVPITSHISPDQMVRLIEGVHLYRAIPGSKLILSGGHDCAEGMADVAEALGVNAQDVLRLNEPRDTAEESQQVAPIVGSQRIILVTSASHMPRAMGLFEKRGMQPIAAPTDFLTPRHSVEIDDLFPDAYKLFKSQVAFYEYLGLAWERLRGKI